MPTPSWTPPREFDEYRLVEPLGHGAMGQVWLAKDTLLERMVAIKFIGSAEDAPELRARFLVEARAAARVQHPNVVAVHRVGTALGHPYTVTELLVGRSLDLLERPLPPERVLELGVQLARGLAAAHRRGVLHRDLKPANAFLTDSGEVKLLDFGLAKLDELPREGAAHLAPAEAPPDFARSERSGAHQQAIRNAATSPRLAGPSAEAIRNASTSPRPAAPHPVTPSEVEGRGEPLLRKAPQGPTPGQAPRDASTSPRPTPEQVLRDAATSPRPLSSASADAALGVASTSLRPGAVPSPALSAAGAVMGTPYYLAPECWGGAPASPASDLYSLGALLYELAAGKPPVVYLPPGPVGDVMRTYDARPLAELAPHVDAHLAHVVDRCVLRDPSARFASADALCDALEALLPSTSRPPPEGNPYRGLLAFEAEHRSVFFGRQSEARHVLERLKVDGCVVVAGDSGAGKSSLCRAAVLPACAEGALGEARAWTVASLVPGRQPLRALASAISAALSASSSGSLSPRLLAAERTESPEQPGSPAAQALALALDEQRLAAALRAVPDDAPSLLRRALGPSRGLVLFVDQLEELVTAAPQEEARAFAALLVAFAARGPSLRLLASVRSDLLGRVASLSAAAAEVLSRSLVLLGPPTEEGLRDVVVGPARLKGYAFESAELVDVLVGFAGRGGALPLLQFALGQLWEARDEARRVLPQAALDRLGGVEGALARHADASLEVLSPAEARAARQVLLYLVAADGTRRRASFEELVADDEPARRAALEALSRARLVVARSGPGGEGYELAHEALVTAWPRLRGWLDDDAGARALRDRLERAAAEWERLERSPDVLFGRAQLVELERLPELPALPSVRAFVERSRRAERRRRLRAPTLAAALLLVAGGAFAFTRLWQARELSARVAARLAEADRAGAVVRAQQARWAQARAAAYRAFDSGDWAGGEGLWRNARTQEEELAASAARTSAAFEAAVLLDSRREDTRARYADWLLQRALAADDLGDARAREELLGRLALFDAERDRGALSAQARVTLRLSPPGATVTVAREEQARGRMERGPFSPFPADGRLAPGGWLLELSAPGHAPARLPLWLRRGEEREVAVALLPAPRVPAGFVHVPRGRFLFGGGGDDELRRVFFEAAPLHEVETGDYLIARRELTYGEYLAFLRALPPAQRAQRLPKGGFDVGGGGKIRLTEDRAGFALEFQMNGPAAVAREGAPLVLPARRVRASQDWSALPVTGISTDDVEAYAAWLKATGRVKGARLCTELEWERAARGADGRTYPHGERLEPDDANFDETYGRVDGAFGPDAVGSHPASDSPFGVQDLAGNAWEVVRAARNGVELVARGGSFYVGQLTLRSMNQWAMTRTFRNVETGARLCADP